MSDPTQTPSTPQLPDSWSFTDASNTVATAPDGSTATGAVLSYVTATAQQVKDLTNEVQKLNDEVLALENPAPTPTPTPTSGPSQADFDALAAKVDAITTAQQQTQALFNALQTAFGQVQSAQTADEATLAGEPKKIGDEFAHALEIEFAGAAPVAPVEPAQPVETTPSA